MSNEAEKFTMDDLNKSLYVTMKLNLRYPINEIVAWSIFGDTTFLEPNTLLYSNYSEGIVKNISINKAHIELMNNIEQDIKKYISKNIHNVDFSTMDSADESINDLLDDFLPKKHKELALLSFKKNSIFKGYPIWWASLVIAYREMAIFAFSNENYYVAIQLNEFCRECQAQMVFKNVVFIRDYEKKLSNKYKKMGSKGGSRKSINYSEPKRKALNYHDKYLVDRNDKGKFIYSNDKSAREIISYFERKTVHLGYTERSLSNIISKHRNRQTKD
ncbi:hypothetical protein [Psychrobacter sp. NG27]|uniref:hypothetical protein n=1 Tax=Psychrobacter sp. NG27 TaxID=2781966 RepID=UPI0018DF4EB3|nr:hypothetical protein [Psychrobacter sp. NG27]MBI0427154.1 hypothetical protein [Psychrobacter sp. NG27]